MNTRLTVAAIILVFGSGCAGPMGERYVEHLGKTLEERIKVAGMPDHCMWLPNGGQVCEWYSNRLASYGRYLYFSSHKRTFIYGVDGLACGWTSDGDTDHFAVDRCSKTFQAVMAK